MTCACCRSLNESRSLEATTCVYTCVCSCTLCVDILVDQTLTSIHTCAVLARAVSLALREVTYPFLAVICLRQGRMTVVGRIEGFVRVHPTPTPTPPPHRPAPASPARCLHPRMNVIHTYNCIHSDSRMRRSSGRRAAHAARTRDGRALGVDRGGARRAPRARGERAHPRAPGPRLRGVTPHRPPEGCPSLAFHSVSSTVHSVPFSSIPFFSTRSTSLPLPLRHDQSYAFLCIRDSYSYLYLRNTCATRLRPEHKVPIAVPTAGSALGLFRARDLDCM